MGSRFSVQVLVAGVRKYARATRKVYAVPLSPSYPTLLSPFPTLYTLESFLAM